MSSPRANLKLAGSPTHVSSTHRSGPGFLSLFLSGAAHNARPEHGRRSISSPPGRRLWSSSRVSQRDGGMTLLYCTAPHALLPDNMSRTVDHIPIRLHVSYGYSCPYLFLECMHVYHFIVVSSKKISLIKHLSKPCYKYITLI